MVLDVNKRMLRWGISYLGAFNSMGLPKIAGPAKRESAGRGGGTWMVWRAPPMTRSVFTLFSVIARHQTQ